MVYINIMLHDFIFIDMKAIVLWGVSYERLLICLCLTLLIALRVYRKPHACSKSFSLQRRPSKRLTGVLELFIGIGYESGFDYKDFCEYKLLVLLIFNSELVFWVWLFLVVLLLEFLFFLFFFHMSKNKYKKTTLNKIKNKNCYKNLKKKYYKIKNTRDQKENQILTLIRKQFRRGSLKAEKTVRKTVSDAGCSGPW